MADRAASDTTPSITGTGRIQAIGERLIMKLPAEASLSLPSRGQVAVEAMVDGHAVKTVLEPDGRKGHWLAADHSLREDLDLDEGDTVEFEFRPARAWPEPEIPQDFQEALAAAPDTAEPWESITAMARWEWVRWIKATRNSRTRGRRIEVAVSKLLAGSRRPCCFDLSSCTDPELSKNGKLLDTQQPSRKTMS